MTKECTTHHHACDCREAKFRKLEAAARKVVVVMQEYWEHAPNEIEESVGGMAALLQGQGATCTAHPTKGLNPISDNNEVPA